MKRKILNLIWVTGVLLVAGFCLSACHRELDVEQSYHFTVEAMPVQKQIASGETAEVRCTLASEGDFKDNRYTIRYFQPDGKGRLKMDDGTVFLPNDRYPLSKKSFRLYYTSLSTERQSIDVYVENSFGKSVKLSFDFNNSREDKTEEKDG